MVRNGSKTGLMLYLIYILEHVFDIDAGTKHMPSVKDIIIAIVPFLQEQHVIMVITGGLLRKQSIGYLKQYGLNLY